MFFDNFQGLLRVLVISVLAYGWLVAVLRFSGKRSLAKLNAFDLVVTVALGSTLATVLLTKDVALAEGALAFFTLALLQWVVSRLSVAAPWFGKLVRSQPRLLVENGEYLRGAMVSERVTTADVDSAVRSAGIGSIAQVGAVVLESDGSLSVIGRDQSDLSILDNVSR